ncbi:macro domain-containing protein [Streptomyces erythrochromogenes]|uniref:macro domain-containing protein n=1 Tax=Streptomyces erythrochromogenes TaxID=285574 RepID=UPI003695417A
MTAIYVSVLGAAAVRRGDEDVRLSPLTTRLLLRLVAAEGEAVASGDLYADLWGEPARGRITRAHRTEVQKRVLELRRALEPGIAPGTGTILRTEHLLTRRGQESAYRLTLGAERLDALEFADLFHRAAHTGMAKAIVLLARALELWRGRPLGEVADTEFAQPLIRRLTGMYEAACAELIRAHTDWDRPELALPVAERLAAQRPHDDAVLELVQGLWARLRERHGAELLRHEFSSVRAVLVVKRGDLFSETDASLVAGFGDTFDTATEDDLVISRDSVQGQLLHRVFGGDRALLDRELRRGLRTVEPSGRESVQDKPRGKRLRYPVGTVVPVPLAEPGRRVFAVAYSRQGLDLVARSTPEDLRYSLDRLWESVARHGLLRPVAIPLVGAGLARVTALEGHEVIGMIAETFLRACRDRPVASELRIVIRPEDLRRIQLPEVARLVDGLDANGPAAHGYETGER